MKSNFKLIISAILILSINLIGCSKTDTVNILPKEEKSSNTPIITQSDDKIPQESTNTKTYENSANGIKIKYPKDWTIQEGLMGSLAAIISPLEDTNDKYRENFNIITENIPENIDLDKYKDASLELLNNLITNYKLLKSEKTNIMQKSAYKIMYTGVQGKFNLEFVQIFSILEKKSIVFTFVTEENKYSKFESIIDEMIKSIELK